MKKFKVFIWVLIGLFILGIVAYNHHTTNKIGIENTSPQEINASAHDSVISPSTVPFFKDYNPTSTYGEVVKHQYYTLSYSEKDEQAEWVSYKLTPNFLNKIKRTDNFREDSLVPTGSSNIADYKNSGYDRGHLAPAASMSVNDISMNESFFMSNMSPQVPRFNRGIWKALETKVREWVNTSDSLFVVTGPLLDHPIEHIGVNKVTVPRAFYKTIIRFKNGDITGIAFIMPNAKSIKTIDFYVTSIDSIEMLTGIDFYRYLSKQIQLKIEANKDLKSGF